MEVDKFEDIGIYQRALEIQKIGNEAVSRALKENKEKGIPIVFSKNGVIYYELPSGEITNKSPYEIKLKEKRMQYPYSVS
jgi:hypothetical protein